MTSYIEINDGKVCTNKSKFNKNPQSFRQTRLIKLLLIMQYYP